MNEHAYEDDVPFTSITPTTKPTTQKQQALDDYFSSYKLLPVPAPGDIIIADLTVPDFTIEPLPNRKPIVPTKGTEKSAGYDLYMPDDRDAFLLPGDSRRVPMGFKIAIKPGCVGIIKQRSSWANRLGILAGVIDEDFPGELQVWIRNDFKKELTVFRGERFCQLLIIPVSSEGGCVVGTVHETTDRIGGFGSTGV